MRSGITSAPRTSASSSRPPSASAARTAAAASASSARQARSVVLGHVGWRGEPVLVHEPPGRLERRDQLVGRLQTRPRRRERGRCGSRLSPCPLILPQAERAGAFGLLRYSRANGARSRPGARAASGEGLTWTRSSSPAEPASSARTSCATRSRTPTRAWWCSTSSPTRGTWRAWPRSRQHPRYAFVQADIADRGAVRAVFREHRPAAVVNFAAETHVDRSIDDPASFVRTNVTGAFELLEAARLYLREHPSRRLPLPPRLDRRGLRHARRDRGVLGGDALRAQLALRRVQGRRRSPGARVPRDVSAARAAHELLEQLRPVPVPREADPAHDPERGRGQEPADLRRRRQRARLALRRGPLPGHPARAAQGRTGREVQHRRRQRANEPAGRGRALRRARRRAAGRRRTPPSSRAGSPPTPASRPSSRIAPATTAATRSTPRRSAPSSAGRRATPSRAGLRETLRWYLANKPWCEAVQSGKYRRERLGLTS